MCNCVVWDDDDERKGEGEIWCQLIACSSLKAPRGAARFNIPIRQTNRYQQYYMPSQHTYCGRVWNLIQACNVQSSDQKVYISTPPSPDVENFQMKTYYPGPAEPEADMLPSQPAWQAIYIIIKCYNY